MTPISLEPFDDPSFSNLLQRASPHVLPQAVGPVPEAEATRVGVPMATTVLGLKYDRGVVLAGDRMAVEGFQVSDRRIEKVFKADDHSALAIAGAAGPCMELVRLFRTELEHYEKIEGTELSTDGKANKLAQMTKANFPLAAQGLVVIPLFVGYDVRRGEGKIYKYDVLGGRYEEDDYHAIGSGGREARSALKQLFRKGLSQDEAVQIALDALCNAAEEDIGTAGPDFVREIYPTVKIVQGAGIEDVAEARIKQACLKAVERRRGL